MRNGIYVAHFRTAIGEGAGVVTIIDNRASGGDAGYVYVGSFSDNNGELSGEIAVQQHTPGFPSVFGGISQVHLPLTGQIAGDSAQLRGEASGQAITINLRLFHEFR